MQNSCSKFMNLHQNEGGIFILPTAWDACSAKLIEEVGFMAIGTTSAGIDYAHGYRDSSPRHCVESKMRALREIIQSSTNLPISADLENGYYMNQSLLSGIFQEVAEMGVSGGSLEDVEDYSSPGKFKLYSVNEASDRLAAAIEGAKKADQNFVITGRTDCFFTNHPRPVEEVIVRLNRFKEIGADCLFAPGIPDIQILKTIMSEVDGKFNVLPGPTMSFQTLKELGVTRISLGSILFREVYSFLKQNLSSIHNQDLPCTNTALSGNYLDRLMI